MDDTIRPAAYGHVSSDKQADELTIESQVAALRQRIVEDGLKLDDELCFLDEGSGLLIWAAIGRVRGCYLLAEIGFEDPGRSGRDYQGGKWKWYLP